MGRRAYPPEFRRRALDLLAAGRKVVDLSRDLGVSEQTIYTWRQQERIDRGLVPEPDVGRARGARRRQAPDPVARGPSSGDRAADRAQRPKSRFAVIAAEGLSIELACRALAVSASGFNARRSRPPSARALRHGYLTEIIRQVHLDSRGTYGARRVHAELVLGHGLVVGHCAVEMLMVRAGIAGLSGRPQYRRMPRLVTAGDLLERQFGRAEPDRLWVTDITEHPTREGKLYCAVVLDVFSRRVVAWSIDASPTAALVTNALGMAIQERRPDGTVIHSDQGTQFTSWAFTRRAIDSGLLPSMGSVGSCYDNAIESFWSRM